MWNNFHSFTITRGILNIGGKWYGMEPLNTSSTFEHVFYRLEDTQDIRFQCDALNGSLHHEMFVQQPVKYALLSNSTFSREKLLRVNTFLFLESKPSPQSVPAAKCVQSSCFGLEPLQGGLGWPATFLLPPYSWTPKLLRKSWNRTAQREFNPIL